MNFFCESANSHIFSQFHNHKISVAISLVMRNCKKAFTKPTHSLRFHNLKQGKDSYASVLLHCLYCDAFSGITKLTNTKL